MQPSTTQKGYLDDPHDDFMGGLPPEQRDWSESLRSSDWMDVMRLRGSMCCGDASAATSCVFAELSV